MKKIFVGNFSFSTNEDELRSWFEPFGQVDSASVVTDKFTGRSRGFGFVEMSNDSEAEKAIEGLNGNGADERLLRAANLGAARILFVAIPEAFEAGQIVQQARRANPSIDIVARAHFGAPHC